MFNYQLSLVFIFAKKAENSPKHFSSLASNFDLVLLLVALSQEMQKVAISLHFEFRGTLIQGWSICKLVILVRTPFYNLGKMYVFFKETRLKMTFKSFASAVKTG